MQVATIGLDLVKHVFQIHGIDAAEKGPVLLLPIGGIDLLLAVSDWLNPPKKH
jgi:hypothetical protein